VQDAGRRVALETARHRITGQLRLPSDGYRSRLSDYLNAPDRSFLALTDVQISALDGSGEGERHDFVAVSTDHVILVVPLDEID
jgi:hypothetical protein